MTPPPVAPRSGEDPVGRAANFSVSTIADEQVAFEVFTQNMGEWWQRGNPVTGRRLRGVKVEPMIGGSLRGMDEQGVEVSWGMVLDWEPPNLFVFDCLADPDPTTPLSPARTGTVTVRFTATGAGITLVELQHQRFDARSSGLLRRTAAGEHGGWAESLAAYTAAADAVTQSQTPAPAP